MRKKWGIPILSVVFFGLESIYNIYFPGLLPEDWLIIPRLLFFLFIFLAVYYDRNLALIYAFVFGLVMDIVFTEVYGIYLLWYPLVVYLVEKLMKILHNNLFIMAFVMIIAMVVLEFGLYGEYLLIGLNHISIDTFINFRLYPSLIANIIFYLFLSYLLKKWLLSLKKIKQEEEGMFQS
ncbi:rod shape-determining protein MreD [Bacillus kwashiorkori]|uniref:rod shape-determining protein MreD n=1 Tax=Bacillus kwashiorkori TaxID=1522318 RepID=UPI000785FF21|nr:rod shape-determining protein MreD [Bacillus kwashiorkori]